MNIFVDLDGVMADFEAYFETHYGFRHDSVDDAVMWHHINSHPNFFGSLPLMPGAANMFREIVRMTGELPFILTACPKEEYAKHAIAKIDWVHEFIDPDLHVLPVMGGKNKALFMKAEGDVLIDDFEKNLKPWVARGGIAIHHTSPEKTISELAEIIQKVASYA